MKKSLYFLLFLVGISACKKPLQATFQRTPQEQFVRECKQINQQLPMNNYQLVIANYLNADSLIIDENSLVPILKPQLLASTKSLGISQQTIIKQKIKPLETNKIKVLVPEKSRTKANLKSRGSNNFWDSWDKNLKLGLILTALLILLAILGVGGVALGIVTLFALWYLIRGLKREL